MDIKFKITFVSMLLISALCGCEKNLPKAEVSPQVGFQSIGYQQNGTGSLSIISAKTQVRLREQASITIQGKAGVTYYISSTFLVKRKMVTVMQHSVAPADGRVTFSWFVSPDTTPGTYPVVITGGGQTVRTSYTVAP